MPPKAACSCLYCLHFRASYAYIHVPHATLACPVVLYLLVEPTLPCLLCLHLRACRTYTSEPNIRKMDLDAQTDGCRLETVRWFPSLPPSSTSLLPLPQSKSQNLHHSRTLSSFLLHTNTNSKSSSRHRTTAAAFANHTQIRHTNSHTLPATTPITPPAAATDGEDFDTGGGNRNKKRATTQ